MGAQCMQEVKPYADSGNEKYGFRYPALAQYLYLKALKQETDELQCHEMEILSPLLESESTESKLWSNGSSACSSANSSMVELSVSRHGPLPTIPEETPPRGSSCDSSYEDN